MPAKPISAIEANILLAQHDNIEKKTENLLKKCLADPANEKFLRSFENQPYPWFKNFYEKVKKHYADYQNAYVFHRNDIAACLKSGAEYLMILTASQYKDDGDIKEGMQTAIIAGSKKTSSGYETVDKDVVGYEHPPKFYKVVVPAFTANFRTNLTELLNKLDVIDTEINYDEIRKDLKTLIESNDAFKDIDKIELEEK